MSTGTAAGAACFSSQAEAASMLCSSLHGVSASGAVSCVGVSGALPSVGGAASAAFTVRTLTGSGPVDAVLEVPMLACETYGADYFAPYVAAWLAAAVAIVAAKLVYQRIFAERSFA